MLSLVVRRKGPGRGEEGNMTALLKSFKSPPSEYGVDSYFLDFKSGSQKGTTLAQYKEKECRGSEFGGRG